VSQVRADSLANLLLRETLLPETAAGLLRPAAGPSFDAHLKQAQGGGAEAGLLLPDAGRDRDSRPSARDAAPQPEPQGDRRPDRRAPLQAASPADRAAPVESDAQPLDGLADAESLSSDETDHATDPLQGDGTTQPGAELAAASAVAPLPQAAPPLEAPGGETTADATRLAAKLPADTPTDTDAADTGAPQPPTGQTASSTATADTLPQADSADRGPAAPATPAGGHSRAQRGDHLSGLAAEAIPPATDALADAARPVPREPDELPPAGDGSATANAASRSADGPSSGAQQPQTAALPGTAALPPLEPTESGNRPSATRRAAAAVARIEADANASAAPKAATPEAPVSTATAIPTVAAVDVRAAAAGQTAQGSAPAAGNGRAATPLAASAGTAAKSPATVKGSEQAHAAGDATAVDRARFVQRVVGAFRAVGDRGGTLRLKLSPPELGSLRIEITVRQGVMTARCEADNPTTRNLLLDNLPMLRERLAQQDIKVQQFQVDVSDRQSGGLPDQTTGGWRHEGRGGRPPAPSGTGAPQTAATTEPAATRRLYDGNQLNVIV
jgi:flagellar hook-length control protein FliK